LVFSYFRRQSAFKGLNATQNVFAQLRTIRENAIGSIQERNNEDEQVFDTKKSTLFPKSSNNYCIENKEDQEKLNALKLKKYFVQKVIKKKRNNL